MPRVAVLDLTGTGLSLEERRNVSVRLAMAVSGTSMAEGMARRTEWKAVLADDPEVLQNCGNAECAQRAGARLAADVVIFGSLTRSAGRVAIELTAVDVETAGTTATYSRAFRDVGEVVRHVRAIALQVVQDLTGQKHPAVEALQKQGLALLRIASSTEGALVSLDGIISATITGGEAWRAIPIDRSIRLTLTRDGCYPHEQVLTVREREVTVQVDLKARQVHWFAIDGVFGGGSMGSLRALVFPVADVWFVSAGLGFTIPCADPLLVNLPVSLGTGLYLCPESTSALRFTVGLQGSMNVVRILDWRRVWIDTADFGSRALPNLGLFLGTEYALWSHLRIACEIFLFPLQMLICEEKSWIQLSVVVRVM